MEDYKITIENEDGTIGTTATINDSNLKNVISLLNIKISGLSFKPHKITIELLEGEK